MPVSKSSSEYWNLSPDVNERSLHIHINIHTSSNLFSWCFCSPPARCCWQPNSPFIGTRRKTMGRSTRHRPWSTVRHNPWQETYQDWVCFECGGPNHLYLNINIGCFPPISNWMASGEERCFGRTQWMCDEWSVFLVFCCVETETSKCEVSEVCGCKTFQDNTQWDLVEDRERIWHQTPNPAVLMSSAGVGKKHQFVFALVICE